MDEKINTLRTIYQHRDMVRICLKRISTDLDMRGLNHDLSKLSEDEFEGFSRINNIARKYPYGSKEYKESLKKERDTIDLHYSRNRHHPEHWSDVRGMGYLDIIEMVCDWYAATNTYKQTELSTVLDKQFERFNFSDEQKWLIKEIWSDLTYKEIFE